MRLGLRDLAAKIMAEIPVWPETITRGELCRKFNEDGDVIQALWALPSSLPLCEDVCDNKQIIYTFCNEMDKWHALDYYRKPSRKRESHR